MPVAVVKKGGRPSHKAREAAIALAERRALLLHRVYALDKMRWMQDQVRTRDEHDMDSPVKPIPILPYVKPLFDTFDQEQITLLVKSRQMMASWLACAYALHTMLFTPHRLVMLISEKFDKSAALVERMRFIYQKMDPWLISMCPTDRQMRDMPIGTLSLANGSRAIGVPEGPDQVRMYTSSLIIIDEADFHQMFEKTYEACAPSIFGGGKMIVMSTVCGGAFSRMCGLI